MLSNHLILCSPLLLLPSIFPSIRIFFIESALHIRWPKYWSFSISPSNEYSGLISFKIDWFDFLVVQRALESLLQHHDSKASVLQHPASFMVLLSHLYTTTGKTIALIIQTFVGQVMSLFFNKLSRFVIAFLPRSKRLLISWLQLPSARACSNSCPLNWWYNSTISSSVVPFSSCLQSFPVSGSFQLSWLFTSGSQNIGTSASPSVLLMYIQDWFLVW